MNWKKAGACAAISASVIFIVLFIFAAANYPGYNPVVNYLSDLGVSGLSAVLFNSAAVMGGFLGVVVGYAFMRPPSKKGVRTGGKIFICSAVSLIGVGLFPEQYVPHHIIFSAVFFILCAISLLVIGIFSRRFFGLLSVLVGLVSLAFIAVRLPIFEHIAVFGIVVWGFAAASYLMNEKKEKKREKENKILFLP